MVGRDRNYAKKLVVPLPRTNKLLSKIDLAIVVQLSRTAVFSCNLRQAESLNQFKQLLISGPF